MDTEQTLVVFRKFKDGAVIAFFPEFINYPDGSCESYMHIGQHGAANYPHCLTITTPAKPSEYAALERELTRIGYNLKIRKRHIKARTDYLTDANFLRLVRDIETSGC